MTFIGIRVRKWPLQTTDMRGWSDSKAELDYHREAIGCADYGRFKDHRQKPHEHDPECLDKTTLERDIELAGDGAKTGVVERRELGHDTAVMGCLERGT